MASTPAAGFPTPKSWGQPKAWKGQMMTVTGAENLEDGWLHVLEAVPLALKASLTEIGLFGEAETKVRTPVHYGVLRASIGHYTPEDIHGGDGSEAQAAALWIQTEHSIEWGTNVSYAQWIEGGFTMAPGRVVNIPGVGFRFVSPFSYRGAHMFEQALVKTADAAPKIIDHWLGQALSSLQAP